MDFIVVGFHHCAYCTNVVHASDAGVRERWESLFDAHEVDLVINGHNHCYERTHLLRGGEVVADAPSGSEQSSSRGTTYVTAGGGGQVAYQVSLYPASYVTTQEGFRLPEDGLWSSVRYVERDTSFLIVDVDPAGPLMHLRAVSSTGRRIDELILRR